MLALLLWKQQVVEVMSRQWNTLCAGRMDLNTFGRISAEERRELEGLVERANRLMLRRAEADSILRGRGHSNRLVAPEI